MHAPSLRDEKKFKYFLKSLQSGTYKQINKPALYFIEITSEEWNFQRDIQTDKQTDTVFH